MIVIYNSLVRLRETGDAAWADIDVQLKRRYDLIPNAVETVKGYAKWFGKNDFRIVRLWGASTWDDLKGHERETLRGIFGSGESTLLSELQHEFYEHLPQIQTHIYSELMQRHYYHHRPDKTKGFYTVFGLAVLVIGLAVGIPPR